MEEDEPFVMLDTTLSSFCWQCRGLYVTGRLKGLAELQAAGLAETWLKTSLGAHKLAPTGNQIGALLATQASLRLRVRLLVRVEALTGAGEQNLMSDHWSSIWFWHTIQHDLFYRRSDLAYCAGLRISAAPLTTSFASSLPQLIVKLTSGGTYHAPGQQRRWPAARPPISRSSRKLPTLIRYTPISTSDCKRAVATSHINGR
jgi:hypothetical protein